MYAIVSLYYCTLRRFWTADVAHASACSVGIRADVGFLCARPTGQRHECRCGTLKRAPHGTRTIVAALPRTRGPPYLAISRLSANGHSRSIHWASQWKPASFATWTTSSAVYL